MRPGPPDPLRDLSDEDLAVELERVGKVLRQLGPREVMVQVVEEAARRLKNPLA